MGEKTNVTYLIVASNETSQPAGLSVYDDPKGNRFISNSGKLMHSPINGEVASQVGDWEKELSEDDLFSLISLGQCPSCKMGNQCNFETADSLIQTSKSAKAPKISCVSCGTPFDADIDYGKYSTIAAQEGEATMDDEDLKNIDGSPPGDGTTDEEVAARNEKRKARRSRIITILAQLEDVDGEGSTEEVYEDNDNDDIEDFSDLDEEEAKAKYRRRAKRFTEKAEDLEEKIDEAEDDLVDQLEEDNEKAPELEEKIEEMKEQAKNFRRKARKYRLAASKVGSEAEVDPSLKTDKEEEDSGEDVTDVLNQEDEETAAKQRATRAVARKKRIETILSSLEEPVVEPSENNEEQSEDNVPPAEMTDDQLEETASKLRARLGKHKASGKFKIEAGVVTTLAEDVAPEDEQLVKDDLENLDEVKEEIAKRITRSKATVERANKLLAESEEKLAEDEKLEADDAEELEELQEEARKSRAAARKRHTRLTIVASAIEEDIPAAIDPDTDANLDQLEESMKKLVKKGKKTNLAEVLAELEGDDGKACPDSAKAVPVGEEAEDEDLETLEVANAVDLKTADITIVKGPEKPGKSTVYFVFANEYPIGNLYEAKASEDIKKLYAEGDSIATNFESFLKTIDSLDDDGLAAWGFVPFQVQVDTSAIKEQAVEQLMEKNQEETASAENSYIERFEQAAGITGLAMVKRCFKNYTNPIADALVGTLNTYNVEASQEIVDAVFAEHGEKFVKELIAKSVELASKDDIVRNTFAEAVAEAKPNRSSSVGTELANRLSNGKDWGIVNKQPKTEDKKVETASATVEDQPVSRKTLFSKGLNSLLLKR